MLRLLMYLTCDGCGNPYPACGICPAPVDGAIYTSQMLRRGERTRLEARLPGRLPHRHLPTVRQEGGQTKGGRLIDLVTKQYAFVSGRIQAVLDAAMQGVR